MAKFNGQDRTAHYAHGMRLFMLSSRLFYNITCDHPKIFIYIYIHIFLPLPILLLLFLSPQDFAWVGEVINNNDLHPLAECSNKGLCDRKQGVCNCFPGYEGVACQRTACVNDCSGRGECYPLRILAQKAGRTYSKPWDANKQMGCVCDTGYRGKAVI